MVRVKNPLASENDELLIAQNAMDDKRAGRHALGKRLGIAAFTSALAGDVLGLIVGGVTLPPSPPTPVESDDPDTSATPYGSLQAALLDEAIMRCRLYLSAATTSIADNLATAVSWDSEDYDVGALHSVSSNTDRVTIPSSGDGLYLVIGQVKWATSASAKKRGASLFKNGAIQAAHDGSADDDGDGMTQQVAALLNLVATDYVQMKVEQDTGAALNLLGGSVDETALTVIRLVQTVNVPLPRCHAYKSGNQTLTHNTAAVVSFDAEAVDNATMHDTVTNNSRVTTPNNHTGHYRVTGQFSLATTLVGYVTAEILKNGSQVLATTRLAGINAASTRDVTGQVGGEFEMTAGDYVELRMTVFLNAGSGTHGLIGGNIYDTSLIASRIG